MKRLKRDYESHAAVAPAASAGAAPAAVKEAAKSLAVVYFEDEIARKIAQALRITLSPQEEKAIAERPTANTQAYDYYLRGRNYARRYTRPDLEFAMQMFERPIALDANFALACAGLGNSCALIHEWHEAAARWIEKGRAACSLAITPSWTKDRRRFEGSKKRSRCARMTATSSTTPRALTALWA